MAEFKVPEQGQGKNPFEGVNHRKMDQYFNQLRKQFAAERRDANNTLSPGTIQKAIRSGKLPPHLEAVIGSKPDGSPFTIEDLQGFAKTRRRLEKQFNKFVGVTMPQLVSASLPIDIERANTEIKSARLYRVRGDLLTFNVTASQKYDADWHQVRVQLMWWNQAMTSMRSPFSAVKKACQGAVKIDCDCGRHQYWYRYIATAGGFALRPYEKDFPKVRNPHGVGCCCKHILKTFQTLMSPTTQAVLSKEMSRQAESAGFGSDSRTQFLTKKDIKKLEKARPGQIDQDKAKAALAKMEAVQKRFLAKLGSEQGKEFRKATNRQRAAMERELKKQERDLQKRERDLQKRERDLQKLERQAKAAARKHQAEKKRRSAQGQDLITIKADLKQKMDFARTFGTPLSAIYAQVADVNNMTVTDVKALAKEL